jgi:hypothetical protein
MSNNSLLSSELLEKVITALKSFLNNDRQLLTLSASERSISHKLAEHLQKEFLEWHVDCEYNRRGDRPKAIPKILFDNIADNDKDAKTIFPDIIVHKRGQPDNLLVVEVKKSNSRESDKNDKIKLKAFTDLKRDYRYKVGLLITFDVSNQNISNVKSFEDGREVDIDTPIKIKLEALGHGR